MLLRERTPHAARLSARLLVLIASALICLLFIAPQPAAAQEDDAAAQEILAMLNGWRIDQNLWPLRENATLDRMAYDQASYILSLPSIPSEGDIHLDARGEGPALRARLPKYDWTPYGDDRFTAVGEIAYVGFSAAAARNFWQNSTIHRNTLLNPAYREIGVAALPQRYGHLYMVEFGARPDVLPAMADTRTSTLYLSNERYSGARSPYLRSASQVRLFDAEGRPLESDWMPWQLTIPLPQGVGDQIYVEYSDGGTGMVLAAVSLDEENAALPTLVPSATPSSTPTSSPTRTPTPSRASGTPAPATSTPGATTSSRTVTSTPTAASGSNALLIYDARSFTLINSGQKPLNVQDVVFIGKSQSFAVTRWATQWLSGSLTALPANDCLEVWSWQEKDSLDKPSACRQRRSILTIAPTQFFWTQGDFEVHWHDSLLAVCHASDTRCEFTVP